MMFVDLMIKGDVDILISGINRVRLKGWYLPVYMQWLEARLILSEFGFSRCEGALAHTHTSIWGEGGRVWANDFFNKILLFS
jgi:hypothetical protein